MNNAPRNNASLAPGTPSGDTGYYDEFVSFRTLSPPAASQIFTDGFESGNVGLV